MIKKYLGKKWEGGARGPKTFDCWGLLWYVLKKEFKIEVPKYDFVDPMDIKRLTRLVHEETIEHWEPIAEPVHGCAVAMSANTVIHHVGVYLDVDGGGVLHCYRGGDTVFTHVKNLPTLGYQTVKFYVLKNG